jgi:tetratricopeptide (TPR) repeat protein
MNRLRYRYLGAIFAALSLNLISAGLARVALAADPPAQSKGESVRPEVGKPLQAAQVLIKAHKYKEATAKIAEAENVGNKTAFESFLIQQMRGSAAMAAGETEAAIRSFEAVIASGRLSGAEQLKIIQAVADMHYRAKNYPKAAAWASRYMKEGGNDPQMRTVLIQAYFLNNDCASVSKLLQGTSQGEEQSSRRPGEDELLIMSSCYVKQKDNSGDLAALEKLVAYYPKKEYWASLLSRIQRKPGFSDRLSLDVFRLKLATANLSSTADYMEMTQLALQAGVPAEARKIVEQGFAAGALGTGTDAERHQRLRGLAMKTVEAPANGEAEAAAAMDGTALVNNGFNQVAKGQADKGIALMEKGIHIGGLRRPEDAKLHLGIALLQGGHKAKAIQTFKSVQGGDGTADLARLWVIHANRS